MGERSVIHLTEYRTNVASVLLLISMGYTHKRDGSLNRFHLAIPRNLT